MSERDEFPAERPGWGYAPPGEGGRARPAHRQQPYVRPEVPPARGARGATSREYSTAAGDSRSSEYSTAPEYSTRPVVVRRSDALAALLLVLAGIAAALSLALRWLAHRDTTGLTLVRHGFAAPGQLISLGLWQPMAVVLGGGVLLVLGLLVLLPARSHRFLGLLALLVSLLVLAAVLVPFADAAWRPRAFDVGFWCAAAVAAFGLLGSLKAALTGPRYGTRAPEA